jgi:NAD(P)-dependent dehydrogenase (short-subunit alcohol dehydrogenase family)
MIDPEVPPIETNKKIALVTGGNRGIGFEICRQLGVLDFLVLLGARDPMKGFAAETKLKEEGIEARSIHLDITDADSIDKTLNLIDAEYARLDVLVNNAGIACDREYSAADVPPELLHETFATNFFGAVALTQKLLPFLLNSSAGRIVNQSSALGSLELLADPESGLDPDTLFAYDASKTALNAFTVHLAHVLRHSPIKVNSAHPGSVHTDMNPAGTLTVEDGARTAVRLATLPESGPTGGFYHLDTKLPW